MKSNASLLYSLALVVGDFFALVAAFVGAYAIRGPLSKVPVATPVPAVEYLKIFLLLLPFWILIFGLLGLYNSSIYEKRFKEAGRLLIGSFVGLLFVIGYAYFENRPIFPARLVPIYGFVLGFMFLIIFRNLIRWFRNLLFSYDIGITNVLIIGDTKIARELVESLADSHSSGYHIVGIVGSRGEAEKNFLKFPAYDSFDEVTKKLHPHDIHSIIQTELYPSGKLNNEILEYAQTNHIAYRFIPGNTEVFIGNIQVELFQSSVPVIAVHQTPLIGWGRIVKRLSDVVVASVALVIASPVMLIVALCIKIFDPKGKVIYRDPRLTRFGNAVSIYKFRSLKRTYSGMTPEEAFTSMGQSDLIKQYRDSGDQLLNDPRVSRIGKFLRRTSLDELPQLINILKGDISFVGPRALHPNELERYDKKDLILAVKSGLTGLAQISGRRDISFEERRKLDLYYVQNWSIWLDLVILIKTVRVVLRRSGAR